VTPPYDLFAACMSLDPRVARIILGTGIGPEPSTGDGAVSQPVNVPGGSCPACVTESRTKDLIPHRNHTCWLGCDP
jgi:hypothetical protein